MKLNALTGIRGVAAWWVVIYHIASLEHRSYLDYAWLHKGYLAVDLFFLLSGFVLSLAHQQSFKSINMVEIKSFWLNRFSRIYPAYGLLLVIYPLFVIPMLWKGGDISHSASFSLFNYALAWLMLMIFSPVTNLWNGPGWSISAEWCAYLLFPLFRLLLNRAKIAGWLVGSLSACCLFASFQNQSMNSFQAPGALIRVLCGVSIGCCLFDGFACLSPHLTEQSRWRGWLDSIPFLSVVLVLSGIALHWPDVNIVLFGMIPLLFGISLNGPWTQQLLGNRWLIYFGEISYSIYICHFLVLILVNRIEKLLDILSLLVMLLDCVSVGLVWAAAHWIHKGVEVPSRQWLRNRLQRKRIIRIEDNLAYH